MRKIIPIVLQTHRLQGVGWYGAFQVNGPCGASLRIIATPGEPTDESEGWDHVSISTANRCPNWPEMCFVKKLFWEDEDNVIQFHPPESEYINNHPYCLHLWKPPFDVPRPPSIMVGVKSVGMIRGAAHAREVRQAVDKGELKE